MYSSSYDNDLRRLRRDWESHVTALPSMLRTAAEELPGKLRLKASPSGMDWTGQFTPLVLLYPHYQAGGFPEMTDDASRRATLAHLHLLIHAFLEDRLRDGQVDLTASELLFMERMQGDGTSLLSDLGAQETWMLEKRTKLVQDYAESHTLRYAVGSPSPPSLQHSTVFRIARQRASYGIVAALAVLHTHGIGRERLRKVRNAFDCLVTALQWLDDLDDWQDDLRDGDDNLLMFTLREKGCETDASAPYWQQEMTLRNAIQREGMVDYSIGRARRYLEAAARKQRELACRQLADLIDKRIELLPHLRIRAVRALEKIPT
jgi:hypothetical protein